MTHSGKTAKPPTDEPAKTQPNKAVNRSVARGTFQRRPINLYYIAGFLAILILGINLGVSLLISDQQLRSSLSDVIPPVVDLLASVPLFIAAKYSAARSKRIAIGWGIIGLSMLFYALADFTWFILEVVLKIEPFPSIADGFYLAYYPAFLAGVFLLLGKPATTGELIKRTLDIAIVFGSAVLGFWNFLIGPIISSTAGQTLLEQGITMAYPVGDLVLIGALFLLLYYPSEKQDKTPVFFLAGSLLTMIIADSIFSYQSLLGTYVSGGLLDLSWITGILLVGLAGISQLVALRSTNVAPKKKPQDVFQDRLTAFQSYVPYIWVTAAFVLLLRRGMGLAPLSMSFLSLALGVGGIIGLVIARQLIALSENKQLNVRLQKSMERIQAQAVEVEKSNLDLQNDILERKLVEVSLLKSEEFNRKLLEASPVAILYLDQDLRITYENQAMRRITGVPDGVQPPAIGQKFLDLPPIKAVLTDPTLRALLAGEAIHGEVVHYRSLAGKEADLDIYTSPLKNAEGQIEGTILLAQDITERTHAETARKQSEALFRALFELSPDAIILIDPYDSNVLWPIVDCNVAACRMNGYARDEMIGHSIDLINFTPGTPAERSASIKQLREAGIQRYEAHHRRKNGTLYFTDVFTKIITVGGRELIVGIDHDLTERLRAEEEIKSRLAELEAINKVSSALRAAQTLDEMLPILLDKTLEVMRAAQGSIWLYDPVKDALVAAVTRGYAEQPGLPLLPHVKPGEGIAGRVFASGEPYVSSDFQLYPHLSKVTRQLIPPGIGGAAIPIRAEENIIGTLIINVPSPRELTTGEVRLLTTLSEIAGNAIRRTSLHQQTNRRLRQLTALSDIDRAITSSFDLRLNLNMLVQQVIAQLGIHAADVLLYNPASQTLGYVAGSGFRTRTFERASIRLGEGYAGRAALERHIIHVPNLAERDDNQFLPKALSGEAFVSYFGVPLLAKGQIKGVLEIFHRVPYEHDAEWLDFLNTLAGQAAIAIDNSMLFDNLQRSNIELAMAYDATIEGWSRALDLRDKETEGHTQRVSDMTVRLAHLFDLSEAELVQVRWGALLHDIGKMGIPDEILFKPGPLTDEEWVVMKKHPVFAYEMLFPIQYLRSALDIPYHHHEKWDGTGYPLGLKGEQIPLTARIFAVVDVWDALRSDRPYRPAWPEEKVREHIRSLVGTHFDPQIVKVFFESDVLASPDRE